VSWWRDLTQWFSARFTSPGIDPSGASVLTTTYGMNGNESIMPTLLASTQQAYAGNAIVFGAILARLSLFSEATFAFRDLADKQLSGAFETDGRRNTALRKLGEPVAERYDRRTVGADVAGRRPCRECVCVGCG
jgi:hypothetical protein